MHILFRPSQTPNIQDRKIGLFKGQFNRKLEKLIADISKAKVVWFKNAKEHDREMAIQQALLHRTILVLGKLFDKCNGSTYVSKKILELRDRICCGNKELYSDIQNNKHLSEQIKVFQKELNNFDINKFWKG
jgi:prephenate dehydrogenase